MTAPEMQLARRKGVELVRTGSWATLTGSWTPNRRDILAAVEAAKCPAVRRPRMKIGHLDPRFNTPKLDAQQDGQPALGWFENLRAADGGDTLVADQLALPWFSAVQAAAYPDRSIEGNYRHRCALGHVHDFVITAVSMLGETAPAIPTLKSIEDLPEFLGVAASGEVPEGAEHVEATVVMARRRVEDFDEGGTKRDTGGRFSKVDTNDGPGGVGVSTGGGRAGGGSGGSAGGGSAKSPAPLKDSLKIGGRIQLRDGETLAGAAALKDAGIALAVVDGPEGRKVRLGIDIDPADVGRWRAADRGSTVVLNERSLDQLRVAIPDMLEWGARGQAHAKALDKRHAELTAQERALVNKQYPDLTTAGAKRLEQIDRRLDESTVQLRSLKAAQQRRAGDLPDAGDRQRMADLDEQIAQKRAEGDLGQVAALQLQQRSIMWGRPLAEVREYDALKAILPRDMTDEQKQRYAEVRKPLSGVAFEWAFFFDRDVSRINEMAERRRALTEERSALTKVSVPLSDADSAALVDVRAAIARGNDEYIDFTDSAYLTDGVVHAEWGDVAYEVVMSGDSPRYRLGVRPPGADRDWALGVEIDGGIEAADLRKLAALLDRAAAPSQVKAAAAAHTGAMVALIPTADDAARLAVNSGEPADQLHVTLAYLGEAADLGAAGQQDVIDAVSRAANGLPVIEAEGFSLNAFNPPGAQRDDGRDRDSCIVLGMSGDWLDMVHTLVAEALYDVPTPEQHRPWHAHMTLVYTDDLDRLKTLVDRIGPVRFDRLRLAFAGQHVDIPLIGEPENLDQGGDEVQATAGDGAQLKRYWLGEGLKRWANKTHPWTSLYRLLKKHISNEDKLRRTVSDWYREHFGHMPNAKKVRAAADPPDSPPPTATTADPHLLTPPDPGGVSVSPAAEPDLQPEEDMVSLDPDVRQRLGLADDADKTAMLAAIDELKTKADTPAEPSPEAIAASAAADEKRAELEKEVAALSARMTEVTSELAAAKAEKVETVKASVLDAAIKDGKIAPADKDQWSKDYDEAPGVTTRVLASIAPGTAVPVMASGRTGPAEPDIASGDTFTDDELSAWAGQLGIDPKELANG